MLTAARAVPTAPVSPLSERTLSAGREDNEELASRLLEKGQMGVRDERRPSCRSYWPAT
ncbi:hypothetical protein BN2476_750103 [Paraburkholderia piptadeniae]|uniref:Uncharacterized protein n=1 Tax=Paraburkholderia piptadeniae TaxID=1701573 RepID=A0A1N7SS59_9BURK|nr:hypothetical protein BN2476_750103 [Paraburkholderia piptadeniae]